LLSALVELQSAHAGGYAVTSTSQGGHSSAVSLLRESGPEAMESTIEKLISVAEEEIADLDAGYTQLELRDAMLDRFPEPIRSYASRFSALTR
jgi:hypothetical protein